MNALRAKVREGLKAVVLSSPTGSGKTVMAQYLISSAFSKGRNVTFVVDRRTLLEQTSSRFEEAGMEHGIIAGSITRGPSRPIKIAMAQTLRTQGWPTVQDLVIVDECHVRSKAVLDLLKNPPCPIIGLTATPMVKGLGADDMYQDIVSVATTNNLIDDGKLAPLEISQCVEIDMRGAPVNTMGEWSPETVAERSRQIVGDIVPTWVEQTNKHFGGPVQTMLFSASIAHGEELCREFQAAGYDFRQVTGKDDDELRQQTVSDFREHKFPGIVSVEALAKGSDFPTVQCLVIARPYRKALAAHIQMLGRGMRSAPGKKKCLCIDHAGNIAGFYDATADFFENGVKSLDDRRFRDVVRAEYKPKDATCKGCGVMVPPGATICPGCGRERKRRLEIETVAGKVIEIGAMSRGKRGWSGTGLELWRACCASTMPLLERHGDHDRANRTAKARFKELAGEWPDRDWKFVPAARVPAAVKRKINANYRQWKASQNR